MIDEFDRFIPFLGSSVGVNCDQETLFVMSTEPKWPGLTSPMNLQASFARSSAKMILSGRKVGPETGGEGGR